MSSGYLHRATCIARGLFRRGRAHLGRRDSGRAALAARIRGSMDLPKLPTSSRIPGSLWAVGLVKNEADIVLPVIEHFIGQGVQGVLVADNGSSDETLQILHHLASKYPVHIALDGEAAHLQALKMDFLCSQAMNAGADWIVPFDADEFWFAPDMSLADYLSRSNADIVQASIHNLFPVPDVEFGQDPWRLEVNPHEQVKVAFRSHPHARLAEGNHAVRRPGVEARGLRVVHVPWRSYEQFRRKTLQGRDALMRAGLATEIGSHWRRLGSLEEADARRTWKAIVDGFPVEDSCWSPGGPAVVVNPLGWQTWDPDRVVENKRIEVSSQ